MLPASTLRAAPLAAQYGAIHRWMWLALPDDCQQEAALSEPEALLRTGHRHLVLRYSDGETVWVFRAAIPEHRGMVGEVVRTSAGGFRVHCLAAARPASTYRDARRFLPLVNREEPLMAADDGSCDPLYGQRMDDADLGRN